MSASDKFNESPDHYIVLDAISRGISNAEKISRASKLDKKQVELIVNDLLTQRLIVKIEKKGFIFQKKKLDLGITDTGMKLLNVKKNELEQKKQQMQQSYNSGNGTQLQSYMDANRMWMPMMLFSGIMDVMFFTSMMSFMGLGINPIENAMMGSESTGSSHEQSVNDNEAGHSAHDQGVTSEGSDSNSNAGADYDNSSFDSGGFDGFDGGGFDSF